MVADGFGMAELVRRTGVPRTTIHHYLRRGILPPPRRLGRTRASYGQEHVDALLLVRQLRSRGYSLEVIARLLPELLAMGQEDAFRPEMWEALLERGADRDRPAAERLLLAGRDLFRRLGRGEVAVEDVCAAAGLGKGSFYHHFRSKDELFLHVVGLLTREVVGRLESQLRGTRVRAAELERLLVVLLEPDAPLWAELCAEATRGRPGYPAALRRATSALESAIAARCTAAPTAVLTSALGRLLLSVVPSTSRSASAS